MLTLVALPPNVLPLTIIGSDSQVLPLEALKVTVGGFGQLQSTLNEAPVVSQPVVISLTVIV
jgi:hypothetical protein